MTVHTHGRSGYNRGCKCQVCVVANRMHRYETYVAKGSNTHICCGRGFTDHGYKLHQRYAHGEGYKRKGSA